MYEFSSKEIRNKFKQTEYGKKTNTWLYISLTTVAIIAILSFTFCTLLFTKTISVSQDFLITIASILSGLFSISVIISCYFDGKRDGAIEQFKSTISKKK